MIGLRMDWRQLCKWMNIFLWILWGIFIYINHIGFFQYPKSKSEEATELAIKVGYRHIDGAYLYGNEAEVGRAIHKKIADGTIRREDLFLTGKVG